MLKSFRPESEPGLRKRALTLTGAALFACNASPPAAPPPAVPTAAPTALASENEANTEASERSLVDPVYPSGPQALDPLATRYCDAIYDLPLARRAQCCGKAPAVSGKSGAECARLLSASLAQKAIALDGAAIDACVTAVTTDATAACERQGRFSPALPGACASVVKGLRPAGGTCRSNAECEGSLQCQGGGPTQAGTCAGPKSKGMPCGAAADVLVAYARLTETERQHPECEGLCTMHRCMEYTTVGGACVGSLQCGPGNACTGGKCAVAPTGLPAGATCPGEGCGAGLVCAMGRCMVPRAAGQPCGADFECRGACLKKGILDKQGTCGPYCETSAAQ